MDSNPPWQTVSAGLALAVPATYAVTAFLPGARVAAFARACGAGALALGLAVTASVGILVTGNGATAALGVRLDPVTSVMLVLVALIGLVIARYSRSYLAGEPGLDRYVRWLLATLGCVALLVISNHLLVIAGAWTASSLALHQLLTFYRRTGALVAAHKKFLVSRLADICFWGGLGLVQWTVGNLNLDAIGAWAAAQASLPLSLQIAAVLFVIAACLKSAQLPFHGWLTQVMEAPTPVSALLHAGLINLGGFVMIRLSTLMVHAPFAQALLVAIGLATTLLAALVMTTRVSVKVALAWSTIAQMGFMLVQCGLGAWHLALLHIAAHSCYKAHAFLSSGSAVEQWRVRELGGRRAPIPPARMAVIGSVTCGLVALFTLSYRLDIPTVAVTLLVGLSLVPMLRRGLEAGARPLARTLLLSAVVAALYFGWHTVAYRALPAPSIAGSSTVGWAIVAFGFAILFAIQSIVRSNPNGRFARRLHEWLFNGLHLDERFTRFTFRIWPPRLTERRTRPVPAIAQPSKVQA